MKTKTIKFNIFINLPSIFSSKLNLTNTNKKPPVCFPFNNPDLSSSMLEELEIQSKCSEVTSWDWVYPNLLQGCFFFCNKANIFFNWRLKAECWLGKDQKNNISIISRSLRSKDALLYRVPLKHKSPGLHFEFHSKHPRKRLFIWSQLQAFDEKKYAHQFIFTSSKDEKSKFHIYRELHCP